LYPDHSYSSAPPSSGTRRDQTPSKLALAHCWTPETLVPIPQRLDDRRLVRPHAAEPANLWR